MYTGDPPPIITVKAFTALPCFCATNIILLTFSLHSLQSPNHSDKLLLCSSATFYEISFAIKKINRIQNLHSFLESIRFKDTCSDCRKQSSIISPLFAVTNDYKRYTSLELGGESPGGKEEKRRWTAKLCLS